VTHSDAPEHDRDTRHEAGGRKEPGEALSPFENLALLYQGLLTGITRLQTERQHITNGESFRRRTKATLQEVERVAVAAGYAANDVRDTHFAVVALLDSVVLHSNDPVRVEWERKTLQEELFGQRDAGVVFFEKLEYFRIQHDSVRLADALEVYLLCLLLGFEGRYSGPLRAELDSITDRISRRIEEIRGTRRQISPAGVLPPAPAITALPPRRSNRLRTAALASAVFTFLFFLILYWNLSIDGDQVRNTLLGRLGGLQ
jgi:type IV/VI secretion system ImpK/VasF family protein